MPNSQLKSKLFKNDHKCGKEYFQPEKHTFYTEVEKQFNDTRLRRETSEKYVELIMVVSKNLVDKYKDKNATDLTSQMSKVYSRSDLKKNQGLKMNYAHFNVHSTKLL